MSKPEDWFEAEARGATGPATPQNAPKAAKDALRAKLGIGAGKEPSGGQDAPQGAEGASSPAGTTDEVQEVLL
jgi:hypothetical protein